MNNEEPAYDDVRALFAATYPRLVRAVTLAGGSQPDAEELVQDAFVRLLPRWDRVRAYDDPEGWVRSVAFRELGKRRRKLQNAILAARRAGVAQECDPPSGDRLDVAAALGTLPLAQRQVVVLHHLLGLDLATIARELRVAEGTVKSRLARARAALRPLLKEDTHA